MTPELIGLLGIIGLIMLLLLKIPVGIALILIGLIGTTLIRGWDVAFAQLGRTPFDTASSYSLSVIPLFILMGMLLSYTGMGKDLYRAVDSWIGHLRGGLAMATIGTAAVFSAISGSLNATTATVSKITLPEMKKYNYKPSLSTACVAAGGTLGILIPPSVILILYGIQTREPIGELLIAGIIPGMIQMIIFILIVALLVRKDPSLAPVRSEQGSTREKLHTIKSIWPFLALFLISIGGIYVGVFTPTEAAGVGAVGAMLFSFLSRRLNWHKLKLAFNESVKLTAYIFLILIGATLFSQFLTISRLPVELTSLVSHLELNPYVILIAILLALFLLGCFIEGLSLIVLTIPIIYPIILELGFNGVWFGIIMVMAINIGSLTPPLGISIFVIKGVATDIPVQTIFKGAIPMIAGMIICVLILIVFPSIVTVLPSLMR
ncbi:TRAP transporter large permease [Virgibacillus pantothenticus]|uniref:TRAP transporter large permease n=1 Tax=Virgibacillus pantothenticus TaxID=1473 RepID=UPI001C2241A2|nr:TRAP transporter large permease [Virgibacillus pantothenticus]MBU8564920.1 TRAP transporter large permease [Virgibacillus pantothenticus]MBU8599228.1 TRAP transporter large permease [Virgibacillus pantothenticus]MBU8633369.1 TRAP transporter large permease [Virgibacillus pantothenticus]MBU8640970.1 TRAP transporter large permease [Virgibacillus pantothenticus]MBU8645101.1 TRAP transporter large permease [Virgibacillus pantothenticus]